MSAILPQMDDLVGPTATSPSLPAPAMGSDAVPGSFGQLVTDGVARVNSQLIGGQGDLQKLAVGDAQNLHQIMINLEESRLSFQLMMQVRSRLLEAYQDIMKMPI
ncbi:flagellar hook-basal body complex protein FliE [Variovorax ginsengisoli]|uniref:Flagellar hook-basal body complex protein FliE n=1 Tax=Variovorax ginsengisoli TaxID=363844 RepID=A0ABT8SE33_9BURK|nr:flagellar hook-basal body complex protein FliE [Variovorax ginsengisoli]MDN8618011.1 flagellar hook-basal body complex protein FliE [Variovorax ginsengisoli]MDO1537181.1 flagellar hook-basal body complex protein FliE [Variovorax ginsengisoli]